MANLRRPSTFAPIIACTILFLAGSAAPARADITAFLGFSPTPARHALKGVSGGFSLLVIGFEFELSHLGEDTIDRLPGLKTYSGNLLVQTPVAVMGTQFYATAGGSGYREILGAHQETHAGLNFGGGAKIKLLGPVRVRLDYRIFQLRGDPLHSTYQRFYVGGNVKF